ncbi:hypothetical protein BH23CHL7_BH23CHL7_01410 [soil metagenome]
MAVYQLVQASPPTPTSTETGVVISVDGPDLARVTSFVLHSAGGTQITFEVETLALDRGGKPAPHLREHLVSGQPIVVDFYRDECCDRLVAVRYRDAPEGSPGSDGSPTPVDGTTG